MSELPLPPGVRSRIVNNGNGCRMHILEAGEPAARGGCVLLLHGFPELAYSWRHQMLPLAAAGYHVVAPDLRGYGRSEGTGVAYTDSLAPFTLVNRVADAVGLLQATGRRQAVAVVGHDYGSPVAAWCALLRPDVFRSVILMSAPFSGPPALGAPPAMAVVLRELATLPRPRQHYWWYYSTAAANQHMWRPPQGLHAFLRAYYHVKSGDWLHNEPFALGGFSGAEFAKLPTYYVMDEGRDMPQTVAADVPDVAALPPCEWLPDEALAVYTREYERTGFQGGLQSYRVTTDPLLAGELRAFAGRTIDVPSCFIAGARDWGVHQVPGALEQMRSRACTRMQGVHLIPGAGHWVQQESPQKVNELLLAFLAKVAG
jgi:pimeloyl-ACP methyl ester carboxylesterase